MNKFNPHFETFNETETITPARYKWPEVYSKNMVRKFKRHTKEFEARLIKSGARITGHVLGTMYIFDTRTTGI